MSTKISPALGERFAVGGFSKQYWVAAGIIYDALLDEKLEWVHLVDPKAGRVDDLVIAQPGQIDAYQVKWHKFEESITYNDLTKKTKENKKEKPSLLEQLSDGWKCLSGQYPDRHVHVHLLTNNFPSSNIGAKIPTDDPLPANPHFAGFLSDCWKRLSDVEFEHGSEVCSDWKNLLEDIRQRIGFSDEEFSVFKKFCHFDLNYQILDQVSVGNRNVRRRSQDIQSIHDFLFNTIGSDSSSEAIHLTRDELLGKMGWEKRWDFRFRHQFFVDDRTYQPISETVFQLEEQLSRVNGGYLALIGTPGSGKSTLLTKVLRYRSGIRFIPYYCFVPDGSSIMGRGEAVNFLHDLVLDLWKKGIRGKGISIPDSREELLAVFSQQLGELHQRWEKHKERTVILVDGLDHIEREQNPERSLIQDLPHPNDVPEGVIFILGTQKLELSGLERISSKLATEKRIMVMQSLSRGAIHRIITAYQLTVTPSAEHLDKISSVSGGHPLALDYLLQCLRSLNGIESFEIILDGTNPYEGHINKLYDAYWRRINDDRALKDLLALLARLRLPIDMKKIFKWVGNETTERLYKQFGHLFRHETETRWHFFHNSFRQFILEQTGRSFFGDEDPDQHRGLHLQLAKFVSSEPTDSIWAWEELYHRYHAGDFDWVLLNATQSYFRNQFFNYRLFREISEDISLVAQAASQQQDQRSLLRILLIETELGEREGNLSQEINLPALLLAVFDPDRALAATIRNGELFISKSEAFDLVHDLLSLGMNIEAKRLFEAAEPLSVLNGSKVLEGVVAHTCKEFESWAGAAIHFRPIDSLFELIKNIRTAHNARFTGENSEDVQNNFRSRLATRIVDKICQIGETSQIQALRDHLCKMDGGLELVRRLDINICSMPQFRGSELIDHALINLLENEPNSYSDEFRVLIAQAIFLIRNDQKLATKLIADITQPKSPDRISTPFGEFWPFMESIRLNRLMSALGVPVDPAQVIKDPSEERFRGDVLFERMLIRVANFWGKAWRKEQLTFTQIYREIHPALILFNRSQQDTHVWTSWYKYQSVAAEFFESVIQAVATHGHEHLDNLGSVFDQQWEGELTKRYWFSDRKRRIALAIFRANHNRQILVERLDKIEQGMDVWDDLHSRITECRSQAMAWMEAGEAERAKAMLPKMLSTSFGVYHEDDNQMEMWVKWLKKANAIHPEGTHDRIRCFSQAMAIIGADRRGHGASEIVGEFLEVVANWNPKYALEVRFWLIEQNALEFIPGLEGMIRASLMHDDPKIEIAFKIVQHLIIPFQRSVDSALPKLLTDQILTFCSQNKANEILQQLARTIETKSFPMNRVHWWAGMISGYRNHGLVPGWLLDKKAYAPREKQGTDEYYLVLQSGEKLDEKALENRVQSFDQFLYIAEQVDLGESRFYRWDKLFLKVQHLLDDSNIQRLLEVVNNLGDNVRLNGCVLQRLMELNKQSMAEQLAVRLLESSRPQGWLRRWDGGSRINLFQTLIKIDSERFQPKAFSTFIQDYLSETRNPRDYIRYFDDIREILFSKLSDLEVWQELEQHIIFLAEFSNSNDFQPPPVKPNKVNIDSVLVSLLFDIYRIPVPEVRDETHRAISWLINNNHAEDHIARELAVFLNDPHEYPILGLAVLEATERCNQSFVKSFEKDLLYLANTADITLRFMIQKLIQNIGGKTQPTAYKELPQVYGLHLPKFQSTEHTPLTSEFWSGRSLPDTNDPLELVIIVMGELKLLSRVSGCPFRNLVARTVQLMGLLEPATNWNNAAESKLRHRLEQLELKIPFRRLRANMTLRAFSCVVGELLDARAIDHRDAVILNKSLILHDSLISNYSPNEKPNFIKQMSYPDHWEEKMAWVLDAAPSLELISKKTPDGLVVIGQCTKFESLESELPKEIRTSVILHPDMLPKPSDPICHVGSLFPTQSIWRASDYPDLQWLSDAHSLVIYGQTRSVNMGRGKWFALNPMIGKMMGWFLSNNGLFRWVDGSGQIMVESIWWQDGPQGRQPPRFDEICSWGWLVVMKPEALNEIVGRIGDVVLAQLACRHNSRSEENDNKLPNTVIQSMSLEEAGLI